MPCRAAAVLLAVLLALLPAAPAGAQAPNVEAAKKEGKVVWYTSLALPADLVERVIEDAGRLSALPHVGPFKARLTGRTP